MTFRNHKIWIGTALLVMFAFTFVSSACATTRKDATLNFVKACRKPLDQEGYFGAPVAAEPPIAKLEDTYFAIQILNNLTGPVNNASFTNALAIHSFLDDLKAGTTGGYKDLAGEMENLKSTYEALQIGTYLNISTMLTRVELNKNENFTHNSYNGNGGFGPNPLYKANATIFNTYYGLKVLNLTGNLTNSFIDVNKVNQFVLSCAKSNNLFAGSPTSNDTSIMATAFATMIYTEFLKNQTDNAFQGRKANISAYIKGNMGQYGGFMDPSIIDVATLATTYYAIVTLHNLGVVEIPNENDNLTNWIFSHQNNYDGGFIESNPSDPSQTSSSMAATYYASLSLSMIDNFASMGQEMPNSLTQIAVPVAIVVLLIGIVACLVIIYYVRKKNKI